MTEPEPVLPEASEPPADSLMESKGSMADWSTRIANAKVDPLLLVLVAFMHGSKTGGTSLDPTLLLLLWAVIAERRTHQGQ